MGNVLIIDDDSAICTMLSKLIRRMGHETECRNTLRDGLQAVLSVSYDVVLLDVQMPDGNGLEILPDIRKSRSTPEVIIMTGFGSADGAEISIKNGAWDYIEKSDSSSKISLLLRRVFQYRESLKNASTSARALKLDGIVGTSDAMKACYDSVAQAAATDSNVLLNGETGTGKELFASAIHNNSNRAEANFVVIDCAALPENLVGSVLFGHEKGAFTGADHAQQGLVAQAHKGTLFLDEIGELPLGIQKVFLRVLQEHRFRPLGAKKEIVSDFRLIAATNRDLEAMVKNGAFREDLLFRLRTLSITLPALRKRPEDIKALVNHYIVKICERRDIGIKGVSSDFMEMITRFTWPGNVREVINTLETAISAAQNEDTLFSRHIPDYIRIQVAQASLGVEKPGTDEKPTDAPVTDAMLSFKTYRKTAVEGAEREYLKKLAVLSRGDVRTACRISHLSRSRFYELIKHHGISFS